MKRLTVVETTVEFVQPPLCISRFSLYDRSNQIVFAASARVDHKTHVRITVEWLNGGMRTVFGNRSLLSIWCRCDAYQIC